MKFLIIKNNRMSREEGRYTFKSLSHLARSGVSDELCLPPTGLLCWVICSGKEGMHQARSWKRGDAGSPQPFVKNSWLFCKAGGWVGVP